MKLKYFLPFFLLLFSLEVLGQKYLLMDKIGGKQRREYYPGEELTFRLKGENHYNTVTIKDLQDSLIILDEGVININEIHTIKRNRRSLTPKLRVAGVGLILIDQINSVVVSGEPFVLSSGVLIAGGSLVAISYIIDLSRKRKFKIRGNRRLKIIDVGFG